MAFRLLIETVRKAYYAVSQITPKYDSDKHFDDTGALTVLFLSRI